MGEVMGYVYLVIVLIAITLSFLLCYVGLKYGELAFSPNKVKLKSFNILNNILSFRSSDVGLCGNSYELMLSKDFKIRETDTIEISYNINRGDITSIREIFINGNLLLDADAIKDNVKISMILN